MKMNAPRRQIVEDALDLYSPTCAAPLAGNQLVELPLNRIRPYHDHPFHLYSGDRLDDMVDSIKKSGVLVPVIVQPLEDGNYEMLAGHNRMQAAAIAGLNVIPAIIKEGLSSTEALYYVVETNVLQRSFSELRPTEQAAVIQVHYSCIVGQGKRNDIDRELKLLAGLETDEQAEDTPPAKDSRKAIAKQYSLSSTKVARLLKLNDLIPEFKESLDSGKLQFVAAVEISYLTKTEQQSLLHVLSGYKVKIDKSSAAMLHQISKSEGLTEDRIRKFLLAWDKEKGKRRQFKSMKVSKSVYQKYFTGASAEQVESTVTRALDLYFKDHTLAG